MRCGSLRPARRTLGLLAVLLGTGPGALLGTTFTWNVGDGVFSTPGSWSPGGGPPQAADTAQFVFATPHTVTFTNSPTTSVLDMTAGDVTFVASGSTRAYASTTTTVRGTDLTLSGAAQQMHLSAGTLSVNNGSTVSVLDGNDVLATSLHIGTAGPVLSGTMIFDGQGSTLSAQGLVNMGQNGAVGTLTFQNNAAGALVALQATSSSSATSGALITVQSGADVSCGNLTLGPSPVAGQSTVFTLTGAGSTFDQAGSSTLTLGAIGNSAAALHINTGSAFTTGTGLMTINKTGTLSIAGGTLNANGNITVSGTLQHTSGSFTWAPGKTMTIQPGGVVSVAGSYSTPTNAVINIGGTGSQLNLTGGFCTVANGTQMTITSGGSFVASGFMTVGVSATTGTVIVDGAGSSITANAASPSSSLGRNAGTGTLTLRNNASGSFRSGLQLGDLGTSGQGTLNVESGATLSVGILTIGTAGNLAGSGTINLSGGSITQNLGSPITLGANGGGPGRILITGGTFTNNGGNISVNDTGLISIDGGTFFARGRIVVDVGGAITIGGSTNNWTGRFDLGDEKMVVNSTAGTKAAEIATLQNQVNYGKTHAFGITSSTLPPNTAIAVMDNGVLGFSTFGSTFTTVGPDSILVAPELLGDANADGMVSFTDYITLANNFGQSGKGWVGGDFDMNGTTNFTDFITLANQFGQTFGNANLVVSAEDYALFFEASAAFRAMAVPEPASLALLGIGMAALLRRGNRRAG